MTSARMHVAAALAASCLSFATFATFAATPRYPTRPIRLVVPFAAGGGVVNGSVNVGHSLALLADGTVRGWGYNGTESVVQAGFLNQPKFEDDLKSLRASFDGELNLGPISHWEVGANYTQRSKDALYSSYFLCPKDGDADCTVSGGSLQSLPIPSEAVVGTVPLDYLGVPGMVALDPLYIYNNLYDASFDNRPDSLARDYNVTEKVTTGIHIRVEVHKTLKILAAIERRKFDSYIEEAIDDYLVKIADRIPDIS